MHGARQARPRARRAGARVAMVRAWRGEAKRDRDTVSECAGAGPPGFGGGVCAQRVRSSTCSVSGWSDRRAGPAGARGRMPSRNRSTVGAGFGRPGPAVDRGATEYYLDAKEAHVTVKSSISLTDEQHAFARALVEAGRYSSLSAVLQQGVDLLRQRMGRRGAGNRGVARAVVPPPQGRVRRHRRDGHAAGRNDCRQAPRAWPSVLSSQPRPNTTSG